MTRSVPPAAGYDPPVGPRTARVPDLETSVRSTAKVLVQVALARERIAATYHRMADVGGPGSSHYRRRADAVAQLAARAWRLVNAELRELADLTGQAEEPTPSSAVHNA